MRNNSKGATILAAIVMAAAGFDIYTSVIHKTGVQVVDMFFFAIALLYFIDFFTGSKHG